MQQLSSNFALLGANSTNTTTADNDKAESDEEKAAKQRAKTDKLLSILLPTVLLGFIAVTALLCRVYYTCWMNRKSKKRETEEAATVELYVNGPVPGSSGAGSSVKIVT